MVPNRFSPWRLFRIDLRPENVDCLVLWTKNPGRLRTLDSVLLLTVNCGKNAIVLHLFVVTISQ